MRASRRLASARRAPKEPEWLQTAAKATASRAAERRAENRKQALLLRMSAEAVLQHMLHNLLDDENALNAYGGALQKLRNVDLTRSGPARASII